MLLKKGPKGDGLVNKFLSRRFFLALALLIIGFLFLLARLYQLQVVQHSQYALKVFQKGNINISLEEYPRGSILDKNGVALSDPYTSNRVVFFPEYVNENENLPKKLGKIFAVEEEQIKLLFEEGNQLLPYEVSWEQAKKIRENNWTGVLVVPFNFRYGENALLTSVIGHLGKVESIDEALNLSKENEKEYSLDDFVGRQGLEKYYEKELKGLSSSAVVQLFIDAKGETLAGVFPTVNSFLVDEGRKDIITTIDAKIQAKIEEVMEQKLKKGVVVVMDIHGDILAMSSKPDYNPNSIEEYLTGKEEVFLDQATTLFQPGSVFKVVTAVAALEEGLISSESFFTCQGKQDPLIACWHEGHGTISFEDAFSQSCNPAFAQLALELGAEKLIYYAEKLGFSNQNILGYPVPFKNEQDLELIKKDYNLINSSVGQGPVLATPVQITNMLNTIVNGGIYKEPRLVEKIKGEDIEEEISSAIPKRVISQKTADKLKDLLILVTTKGIGQLAYITEGGSGGKTGSAQLGDLEGNVNAWFVGFFPLDSPQYIITVLVREGKSGGDTAAPLFKEIAEEILSLNL